MATNFDPVKFHEDLVRHKLIIPSGVPGVFGRGTVFEDVVNRFRNLVLNLAKDDGAEPVLFPPVISRKTFEKSEFLESFPQLAGTVFSFFGKDPQHKELMEKVRAGKPWADMQQMTDVVLTPAACYPVYPYVASAGPLGENGRLVNVEAWAFRHEPSPEPTRMQSFRIHEFIRVGTPEQVIDWRNMWLDRGLNLLLSLGLDAKSDAASDPFFGRGGRMMAANQREQKLKFEVLVPVIAEDKPTAVCSFNYHQDHFSKIFDIKTQKGELAQTACLGFGMERVVMALFKTHGFIPAEWPAAVREKLWP
jgi:seryl-tRNA synthetase